MRIDTAAGPARAVIESGDEPGRFLFVLTHGAGGDVDAPDLLAARAAALRLGGTVARVTQPYRVAGARAPGSAVRQDASWVEVIGALRDAAGRAGMGAGVPLVQGGRSNGARVACRTAVAVGALGVVALAFPLRPPGQPGRTRAAELRLPGVKLLLVSGERDPFGVPGRRAGARLVVLPGETHALSRHPEAVGRAVAAWLRRVLKPDPGQQRTPVAVSGAGAGGAELRGELG